MAAPESWWNSGIPEGRRRGRFEDGYRILFGDPDSYQATSTTRYRNRTR
jgi:hypothetical protein